MIYNEITRVTYGYRTLLQKVRPFSVAPSPFHRSFPVHASHQVFSTIYSISLPQRGVLDAYPGLANSQVSWPSVSKPPVSQAKSLAGSWTGKQPSRIRHGNTMMSTVMAAETLLHSEQGGIDLRILTDKTPSDDNPYARTGRNDCKPMARRSLDACYLSMSSWYHDLELQVRVAFQTGIPGEQGCGS